MMKRSLLLSALVLISVPAFAKSTPMAVSVDHGVPLTLSAPAVSVFVANPDIADIQVMSPTQVMIFGKRTGQTSFLATDGKGQTLAERTITVSQDLSDLRGELDAAIPGNAIKVKAVPNGIIMTGTAKDATAVADAYKIAMRYLPAGGDIINRVQVNGSNQVQIRVRFAEVQRSIDNSLGFNWKALGNTGGGMTFGLATGSTSIGSGSTLTSGRPNNTALSLANDVLGMSYKGSNWSLDSVIDALAQEGFLTILAEPNLTAMSGETANFLAGGEFPIPIPQGNGTISITFKSYGISLAFTPTLIGNNRINLHVRPEVSELTDNGSIVIDNITVPALTTRKAETTVEVGSGESFAVAGLLSNSQSQTVNKFPLLGDMPVLGSLFRSNRFQNGQTELVVIITPYIVKPSGERLNLPTDGYAPPSEIERLWGRRKNSADPDARPVSGDPIAVKAAPMLPVTSTPTTTPLLASPPAAPAAPVAATEPTILVVQPAGKTNASGGGLTVE